jgi:hypothetical protein
MPPNQQDPGQSAAPGDESVLNYTRRFQGYVPGKRNKNFRGREVSDRHRNTG